jgi:hypothetical protein
MKVTTSLRLVKGNLADANLECAALKGHIPGIIY